MPADKHALSLAAAFSAKHLPQQEKLEGAAVQLIEEVGKLLKQVPGFHVHAPTAVGGNVLDVRFANATDAIRMVPDREGVLLYAVGGTKERVAGLVFNPLDNRLDTEIPDTFYTPTPGDPRRTRTAVSVVVERVLALIKI